MNAYYDCDDGSDDRGPTLFFESSGGRPRAFYEAAALLLLFSVLILHQGAMHLLQSNPSLTLFVRHASRPMPPVLLFLASLSDLLFGFLGLLLALLALVLSIHSPPLTRLVLFLQVPLSLFSLSVRVFGAGVYRLLFLSSPLTAHLTLAHSRVVLSCGVLTALSLTLALYGGQFLFLARLVAAGSPGECARFADGSIARPMACNANLASVGLWTLLASLFVLHAEGGGRVLRPPLHAPPHVVPLPLFAFLAGLVLLFWGIAGVLISCAGSLALIRVFVAGSVVVYVVALMNFALLQLALVRDVSAAIGGTHAGLVFCAAFLGPYFMVKQVEEKAKMRMSMDQLRSFQTQSEPWVELERNFELEKV